MLRDGPFLTKKTLTRSIPAGHSMARLMVNSDHACAILQIRIIANSGVQMTKTRTISQDRASLHTSVNAIVGDVVWSSANLTVGIASSSSDLEIFEQDSLRLANPDLIISAAVPLSATEPSHATIYWDILHALEAISNVANITFEIASNGSFSDNNTTLRFAAADMNFLGGRIFGLAEFPGDSIIDAFGDATSYIVLNPRDLPPVPNGGVDSTFQYEVVLHETLHSLGLAHPHDTGNGSISNTGVDIDDNGAFDNARYTLMSYETRGINSRHISGDSNYSLTPMALDISALHIMYGSSELNAGDTVYELNDPGLNNQDTAGEDGVVSISGSFYSIWDTGGRDTIKYGGSENVLINLTNALVADEDFANYQEVLNVLDTDHFGILRRFGDSDAHPLDPVNELSLDINLAYAASGGLFSRSFDFDDWKTEKGIVPFSGGFSIASDFYSSEQHVGANIIENAVGGDKFDILIGNAVSNRIEGRGGDDFIVGGGGGDLLYGGAGADIIYAGSIGLGIDLLDGGSGEDKLVAGSGWNQLIGGGDNDQLFASTDGTTIAYGGEGNFDSLVLNGHYRDFKYDFQSGDILPNLIIDTRNTEKVSGGETIGDVVMSDVEQVIFTDEFAKLQDNSASMFVAPDAADLTFQLFELSQSLIWPSRFGSTFEVGGPFSASSLGFSRFVGWDNLSTIDLLGDYTYTRNPTGFLRNSFNFSSIEDSEGAQDFVLVIWDNESERHVLIFDSPGLGGIPRVCVNGSSDWLDNLVRSDGVLDLGESYDFGAERPSLERANSSILRIPSNSNFLVSNLYDSIESSRPVERFQFFSDSGGVFLMDGESVYEINGLIEVPYESDVRVEIREESASFDIRVHDGLLWSDWAPNTIESVLPLYLEGSAEGEVISGDVGNDRIHGLGGNDRLWGGDGDDLLKADRKSVV